jgi:hypothetical protein
LNQQWNNPARISATTVPDLLGCLRTQRRRIAALAKKTIALQARGMSLLAESSSLARLFEQSRANLARTHLTITTSLAELRQRRSFSRGGKPHPAKRPVECVLADSPDVLDALQQATEILKMEFSDTEGSGRQTLAKCEQALQRTRSTQTIELSLY